MNYSRERGGLSLTQMGCAPQTRAKGQRPLDSILPQPHAPSIQLLFVALIVKVLPLRREHRMSTFFIYIQNPESPAELQQVLAELRAKKHSAVSWVVESDLRLETLLLKIGQWVQKEGFIFMANLARSHDEMYWPAAAQQHLAGARTDLEAARAQHLTTPPPRKKITARRRSP